MKETDQLQISNNLTDILQNTTLKSTSGFFSHCSKPNLDLRSLLKDSQTWTYCSQVLLTLSHTQMLRIRLEIFHDSQHFGLQDTAEITVRLNGSTEEVLHDFPKCLISYKPYDENTNLRRLAHRICQFTQKWSLLVTRHFSVVQRATMVRVTNLSLCVQPKVILREN